MRAAAARIAPLAAVALLAAAAGAGIASCSAPARPDAAAAAAAAEPGAPSQARRGSPPAAPPATSARPPRRSGFDDMSPATQAMQRDDAANPAWLWVEDGRQRFAAACARCHDAQAMAGVAARHPAWDAAAGRPLTLGQRIAACHARHVQPGSAPLAPEDETRLALETFVALQSRGRPIAPPSDPRLVPWRDRGRALFEKRMGQLDLACVQCHERHAGQRLAGSVIPQGHPTGYPIYRLEWQGMGSLQRRLRGCLVGVRAEPFGADSDEATALEVFLMHRAAGLAMETPAVRP